MLLKPCFTGGDYLQRDDQIRGKRSQFNAQGGSFKQVGLGKVTSFLWNIDSSSERVPLGFMEGIPYLRCQLTGSV